MTRFLADKIATYLSSQDESVDKEVLAYGYEIILQEFVGILVMLLSSLVFHLFWPMLVNIVIYTAMRLSAGGAHAKSHIICDISYACQLYGTILLSMMSLNRTVHYLLFLVGLLLLVLYAPGDTLEQPIVAKAKIHKIVSIIVYVLCMAVSTLIWQVSPFFANLLIVTPTLCCSLTHPIIYKLYRCEKHRQNVFWC